MLFGLDGVEVGLIIVFLTLFAGIMTGFPVAFRHRRCRRDFVCDHRSARLSAGLLIHQAIDTGSAEYSALVAEGVVRESISVFRYPDLPRIEEACLPRRLGSGDGAQHLLHRQPHERARDRRPVHRDAAGGG
jgi:hypothetical protein